MSGLSGLWRLVLASAGAQVILIGLIGALFISVAINVFVLASGAFVSSAEARRAEEAAAEETRLAERAAAEERVASERKGSDWLRREALESIEEVHSAQGLALERKHALEVAELQSRPDAAEARVHQLEIEAVQLKEGAAVNAGSESKADPILTAQYYPLDRGWSWTYGRESGRDKSGGCPEVR